MNEKEQTMREKHDYKISKESIDKFFPKENIQVLDYESPIQVFIGQMRMEQENGVFKAIQEQGIDVNKEELIKALQYDRNQYDNGYVNGYLHGKADVAEEIFAEIEELKRYIRLNEDIAVKCKKENGEQNEEYWKGKVAAFRQIRAYIDAELKKKYTKEITEGGE